MSKERVYHNRYVSDGLHPYVYRAMIGLVVWYALSAWAGFGGGSYANYLLVVMTGFLIISVALPAIAGRLWLRHHHREPQPPATSRTESPANSIPERVAWMPRRR
ncbi:hypothetical protein [Mesorhizobium sp. M00.F.Ca.ET.216.01.1.1]|uniref:hypothetical protein n=1 Tax=Mesorhizobium sp. M00.F.Ca.ET.216.01.1.1 TaxID=2500528 RepID=UPI000FDAC0AA|nr:hypothetical protein [Mesorhizobium sp. M00.F.Ca.ET.216.01.1.1]TGQ43928.1 hypothetical protein EN859_009225 [Mesorhizobium sp. M00.F.Ca.ET.216.01.1.1]